MEKQTAIDELNRRKELNLQMGGKERVERQHQLGRLTARERIEKLFDPGTFVESDILMQNFTPDSEGKITHISKVRGFGEIDGRTVVVHADDATVMPGTAARLGFTQQKGFNPAIYPELCYPVITLGDGTIGDMRPASRSPGMAAATYPTRELLTPRRVPHVVTIMGDCFGPPAWQAATADFVVMVKGARMAISEPGLEVVPEGIARRSLTVGSYIVKSPAR